MYLPYGEIDSPPVNGFSMFGPQRTNRRHSPYGRRRSAFAREMETGMLKLMLIGNLGADPEMQYAPSGQPRLRFNVAGNYRGKNQANEWEEKTEWVRVTVFGNRAESLFQILRKGTKVYADGRLEARPWTDNNGNLRAGLELVADTLEICSSRQQDDGYQMRPANTVNRQPAATGAGQAQGGDDGDLESLPF